MAELFSNLIVGTVVLRDRQDEDASPIECIILRSRVMKAGRPLRKTEGIDQWISLVLPSGKIEVLLFDQVINLRGLDGRPTGVDYYFEDNQLIHIAVLPEGYERMFKSMVGRNMQGTVAGVQISNDQWESPFLSGDKAERKIFSARGH
jgi:hypothetical protein